MSVPLTPQLMVLGQETPTSPSQDKREWLPNLISHPSNAFISCYRPVFSGDCSKFPHLFQHLSSLGKGIASVIWSTSVGIWVW